MGDYVVVLPASDETKPAAKKSQSHTDAEASRGRAAMDFRASRANVWRRRDRHEPVQACAVCGCEVDVELPAHEPRCKAAGDQS